MLDIDSQAVYSVYFSPWLGIPLPNTTSWLVAGNLDLSNTLRERSTNLVSDDKQNSSVLDSFSPDPGVNSEGIAQCTHRVNVFKQRV